MSWIDILATRQEVDKRIDIISFELKANILEAMRVAVDKGDIVEVKKLANDFDNIDKSNEQYNKERTKCCDTCGEELNPHSTNWFEGRHIDGCE